MAFHHSHKTAKKRLRRQQALIMAGRLRPRQKRKGFRRTVVG